MITSERVTARPDGARGGERVQIKVVCVGRAKGAFKELSDEYEKRIRRYAGLELCEVEEAKYRGSPSDAEIEQLLKREALAIRRALEGRWRVVVLDAGGTAMDSVRFARRLEEFAVSGEGAVAFVIGGSLGLDGALKTGADIRLSLSAMTLPHQLARVVLLEQLYRAFAIMRGEPYHK